MRSVICTAAVTGAVMPQIVIVMAVRVDGGRQRNPVDGVRPGCTRTTQHDTREVAPKDASTTALFICRDGSTFFVVEGDQFVPEVRCCPWWCRFKCHSDQPSIACLKALGLART